PQVRGPESRQRAVCVQGEVPPRGQVAPVRGPVGHGRVVSLLRRLLKGHISRVRYAWYRDGLLGGQIAVRVDDEGVRRRAGYPGGLKLEKAGGHGPGNEAREARVYLKRVVEPGDDAGTEERPASILDVPEQHQRYGGKIDRDGGRSAHDDRRFHRRKQRGRRAQLEG